MKLSAFVLFSVTSLVSAGTLKSSHYLQMQDALASDDFKGAMAAHGEICKSDVKKIKVYRDCGKKFNSMEELRESFKGLSETFIKHIDKSEMSGLMVATCPMANARWIQKEGGIRNPYYGKSMLDCGEKVKQ